MITQHNQQYGVPHVLLFITPPPSQYELPHHMISHVFEPYQAS